MNEPGHCITSFAATPNPPGAVWTFTNKADAQAWIPRIKADNPKARVKILQRLMRVDGANFVLFLLVIR